MSLPMCELFSERSFAASNYILVIIMLAEDENIIMSWGEAAIVAIKETPQFAMDWVNPN